jgi:CRISPR-associated protein Cas2
MLQLEIVLAQPWAEAPLVLVLVTYDVATVEKAGQRRLRRVARACEDYGVRVQKSVFECQVGQTEWVQLKDRLLKEIKGDEDSLRFYYLDETAKQRIEHHGVDKPVDLTEPLIL